MWMKGIHGGTVLLGWFLQTIAMSSCMGQVEAAPPDPGLTRVLGALPGPMAKINLQPLESVAAPGQRIDLWVSEQGEAEYLRVHLSETGSHSKLPTDAGVVRAILGPDGQVTKYTALRQLAPGYNPPSDLWFAVYDRNGDVLHDEAGAPMEGAISACVTCHLSRPEDGYVFGVPGS